MRKHKMKLAAIYMLENLAAMSPMKNGLIEATGTYMALRLEISKQRANRLLNYLEAYGLIERYTHRGWIRLDLDAAKTITSAVKKRLKGMAMSLKLMTEIKRRNRNRTNTVVLLKRTKKQREMKPHPNDCAQLSMQKPLVMKGDAWKARYGLP